MSIQEFKLDALVLVVGEVAKEIGCSTIEAISKMQAQCVVSGNEGLLEDLCAYKNQLIYA